MVVSLPVMTTLIFGIETNILAATALYMKIQHLETMLSISNAQTISEEIMDSYVILINVLSCLPKSDRWIAVNKVITSKFPRGEEHGRKVAKFHNRGVERVALKLSDICSEYGVYVGRKDAAVVKKLSFHDF